MKQCTKCSRKQAATEFHKGTNPDGLRTWCKTCVAAYKQQYRVLHAERIKEQQRNYDAAKQDERRGYFKTRYLHMREHINTMNAVYRQQFPEKHAAKEARRRTAKLRRTPIWLTADDFWMIEQAYELAACRSKLFGVPWEVDHVFPLQGKFVSGLHVPANLQVIPAAANRAKTNRFEVAL
jgi:hypothetical protein